MYAKLTSPKNKHILGHDLCLLNTLKVGCIKINIWEEVSIHIHASPLWTMKLSTECFGHVVETKMFVR